MIIFKQVKDLSAHLQKITAAGNLVGFAPTMGALHQGHIALVKKAREENQTTVASIFVNPTQFNDPKDFEKYPKTIEKDIYLLEEAGCDVLFLPYIDEVYPAGLQLLGKYDLGDLETILEGKFRPGHFQGVCKVVHRLLDIVKPHNLYMGKKDYQQCMVIQKLLELTGMDIRLVICPTLREPDGLAMSSRNLRLSPEQRMTAPAIADALQTIAKNMAVKSPDALKIDAINYLTGKGFKVDYIEIADRKTLQPLTQSGEAIILAAAFIGDIRLIDNMDAA